MSFDNTVPIGSAAWGSTLLCPQNGKPSNQENWEELFTQLGNRLAYLYERGRVVDSFSGLVEPVYIDTAHWVQGTSGTDFQGWFQDDITAQWTMKIPVPRPRAAFVNRLVSLTVYLKGSAGHLPANLPIISLQRGVIGDMATGYYALDSTVDPSSSIGEYTVEHPVTLGPIGSIDFDTYTYLLGVQGESGTAAAIGLGYFGFRAIFDEV